jgi:hypothetical protein
MATGDRECFVPGSVPTDVPVRGAVDALDRVLASVPATGGGRAIAVAALLGLPVLAAVAASTHLLTGEASLALPLGLLAAGACVWVDQRLAPARWDRFEQALTAEVTPLLHQVVRGVEPAIADKVAERVWSAVSRVGYALPRAPEATRRGERVFLDEIEAPGNTERILAWLAASVCHPPGHPDEVVVCAFFRGLRDRARASVARADG